VTRRRSRPPSKSRDLSKPDVAEDQATFFEGRALWGDEELSEFFCNQIGRAIFRDNEISFDWVDEGEIIESTHLRSRNKINFQGQSINSAGTPEETKATVEAALYSNPNGHVLVGQGVWDDGRTEMFIAQFFGGKRKG